MWSFASSKYRYKQQVGQIVVPTLPLSNVNCKGMSNIDMRIRQKPLFLQSNQTKHIMARPIKIVHVHFLSGHKNFYFGSVKAIYKKFSPEEIGCSEIYLRHQLTEKGNHFINGKVLVIRSALLR